MHRFLADLIAIFEPVLYIYLLTLQERSTKVFAAYGKVNEEAEKLIRDKLNDVFMYNEAPTWLGTSAFVTSK